MAGGMNFVRLPLITVVAQLELQELQERQVLSVLLELAPVLELESVPELEVSEVSAERLPACCRPSFFFGL